jgi:hypothetical protein
LGTAVVEFVRQWVERTGAACILQGEGEEEAAAGSKDEAAAEESEEATEGEEEESKEEL